MLLYAYHVHGRVSQWQLFVTVWCSLITLYWVVIEHSSFLNNCYILNYTMLQCCLCILGAVLVHVPCLSEISLWNSLHFFFTNLNLIKLMFVSCSVALRSLLCVCSLADVSPFLSRKRDCNWCSIIPHFKTDLLFVSRLKKWKIQDSSWFANTL